MGTRERHIGHAAARSAPVADPRGGRLFAMPRFLVGITHLVYRRRAFVIAGVITALFLLLLAVLPASFASDPKLSNTVPIYNEVSKEVVDGLIHSSSIPLLLAAVAFSIWGVLVYLRCLDYVLRRRLVAVATISALWMIEVILKYKSFTPFYATVLWYLYYVPMTLIPLLYQLCGLRLEGWSNIVRVAATAQPCGSRPSCSLGLCLPTIFTNRSFISIARVKPGVTITRTAGAILPF